MSPSPRPDTTKGHPTDTATTASAQDLYLDTINRNVLDFDFERICSVSLSNLNVYACLVCGRYFQGRGKASHAYTHSLNEDHHVFINLETLKVYCLPEGYEVEDPSLNDIRYLLNPTFTSVQVKQLDISLRPASDLNGKKYVPGFVGLNNIKANDYMNVVLHALAHIPFFRDYFILMEDFPSELERRLSVLFRRIWSGKAFKRQVSPHELLQEIASQSDKQFLITRREDPVTFLSWFLNFLDRSATKQAKRRRSKKRLHSGRFRHEQAGGGGASTNIVRDCFQGTVEITKTTGAQRSDSDTLESSNAATSSNFLMLTLDLPPPPLFKDDQENSIIPQVPLLNLLAKYDGVTQITPGTTYRITKCPRYLILNIKRFTRNTWETERNPTIVNFPIANIDLGDFITTGAGSTKYDLLANICIVSDKSWKVHVKSKALAKDSGGSGGWFEIQDLTVSEVNPQMIFLGESCLQIWERQ